MSLIEKEPILRILEAAIEKENNTAHEYALKGADYAEYHAKYTHGTFCYLQARKAIADAETVENPYAEAEKWYGEYHKIKDELAREKAYQRESAKLADKYFVELKKLPGEIFSELRSCVDYIEEQLPEGELPSAFVSLKEDIAALEKKYVGEH